MIEIDVVEVVGFLLHIHCACKDAELNVYNACNILLQDDGFHYSCSSYGSPASVHTNCSTNSNDTDHSNSGSSSVTTTSHIHHNHTYPTQPGQTPREVSRGGGKYKVVLDKAYNFWGRKGINTFPALCVLRSKLVPVMHTVMHRIVLQNTSYSL